MIAMDLFQSFSHLLYYKSSLRVLSKRSHRYISDKSCFLSISYFCPPFLLFTFFPIKLYFPYSFFSLFSSHFYVFFERRSQGRGGIRNSPAPCPNNKIKKKLSDLLGNHCLIFWYTILNIVNVICR